MSHALWTLWESNNHYSTESERSLSSGWPKIYWKVQLLIASISPRIEARNDPYYNFAFLAIIHNNFPFFLSCKDNTFHNFPILFKLENEYCQILCLFLQICRNLIASNTAIRQIQKNRHKIWQLGKNTII